MYYNPEFSEYSVYCKFKLRWSGNMNFNIPCYHINNELKEIFLSLLSHIIQLMRKRKCTFLSSIFYVIQLTKKSKVKFLFSILCVILIMRKR